jgi:fibronectin-binding autotransporter adhesin
VAAGLTLTNALTWGGSYTFAGSNALNLSGPVALTANDTVTVTANTLTVSGAIERGVCADETRGGRFDPGGREHLHGRDDAGGGHLALGSATALGTGTLTITGGTLTQRPPLTVTNASSWGGSYTFAGSNPLSLSGAVALTAATR